MLQKLATNFEYPGSLETNSRTDVQDIVYNIFLAAVHKAGLKSGDPDLMYDLKKPQLYYCGEEVNSYEELLAEIEFEKKMQYLGNVN